MSEEKPKVRTLFPKEPAVAPAPPASEEEGRKRAFRPVNLTDKPSSKSPVKPLFAPTQSVESAPNHGDKIMEYEADWDPATNSLKMRPGTLKPDPPVPARVVKPKQLFAPIIDLVPSVAVPVKATTIVFESTKIRTRIVVELEQLKQQSVDVNDPASYGIALQALLVTNLEEGSSSQFLGAGLKSQETFAQITSRMLALSTSPDLASINAGLREIGDVLDAAELRKLLSASQKVSWKSWTFGLGDDSFDAVKKKITDQVREVADRSDSLRTKLPRIRIMLTAVDVLEQDVAQSMVELEADMVFARFLIAHLKQTLEKEFYKEWADQLQRRLDSLTVSRITARQATLQLRMVRQHLTHLTETVYTALVNMVPAWCGNCVTFLASARKPEDVAKGIGPLASLRDDILKLLKE